MFKKYGFLRSSTAAIVAAVLAAGGAVTAGVVIEQHDHGKPAAENAGPGGKLTMRAKPGRAPAKRQLSLPPMNAERGMRLFAVKGCVACHAVNGVGGDHTALDARTMDPVMNPFDFVAKMWTGAPAMVQAQQDVLGHQILFTGAEIADIIAFVHDDAQQREFSEAMIPPDIKQMMQRQMHDGGPGHHDTASLGHGDSGHGKPGHMH